MGRTAWGRSSGQDRVARAICKEQECMQRIQEECIREGLAGAAEENTLQYLCRLCEAFMESSREGNTSSTFPVFFASSSREIRWKEPPVGTRSV